MRTSLKSWTLMAVAMLLPVCVAVAQEYPTRAIRFVVPYPPGGGTDIFSRLIAQKLNEAWDKPVVVENRSGADGTIGAAVVANAAPDGYTLMTVASGFTANPSIYKNLPFDVIKDFAPVTQLAANPSVLAVHPSLPPRTVKELIAFLKANPNEINYASSGSGTPAHMMAELFKLMTGTRMHHVPYRGGGPATIGLVSGEVPIYVMSPMQAAPHMKSGRLRVLGVTSDKRDPAFPEIPTIAEAGVPGYAMTNWYGMLVRAGTPKPIIAKINAEVVRILNLADIKERLAASGVTVVGSTPEQFAAFVKEQVEMAARIFKATGQSGSSF